MGLLVAPFGFESSASLIVLGGEPEMSFTRFGVERDRCGSSLLLRSATVIDPVRFHCGSPPEGVAARARASRFNQPRRNIIGWHVNRIT